MSKSSFAIMRSLLRIKKISGHKRTNGLFSLVCRVIRVTRTKSVFCAKWVQFSYTGDLSYSHDAVSVRMDFFFSFDKPAVSKSLSTSNSS